MVMSEEAAVQIDLKKVLEKKAPGFVRRAPSWLIHYLVHIIHHDELNDILHRYKGFEGVPFMQKLIGYFDLNLQLSGEDNIPSDRRLIFVSNHPLGGLDGICLSAVIGERFNSAIRFLVNDFLLAIPNLRTIFLPVNKFGEQGRHYTQVIEEAFASDNQILTFPAGLCSRLVHGKVQDLDWKKSFITKAVQYQRDVVPLFFDGKNSMFFYRIANLRKKLGIKINYELAYLPNEMFKSKHKTFQITFGKPIPWQTFDHSYTPEVWASRIREEVYRLKK